jgi:uncharacterized protein
MAAANRIGFKSLLKFIFVFAAILLLSAVLAPLLFDILPFKFKFERIFNRLVMIFSLIAVFSLVRFNLSETISRYGLVPSRPAFQAFLRGFVLSALILIILISVQICTGKASINVQGLSVPGWIGLWVNSLLAAVLIGFIEEFFFRGFIYRSLKHGFALPLLGAVLLTNIFYALLHYIDSDKVYIGPDPQFSDSLTLMAAPLRSWLLWQEIWPGAAGLFIFGVILTAFYFKTRSLYTSIGTHAGCVFILKLDGNYVDFVGGNAWLWGSGKLYDGLAGWMFILLMGFVIYQLSPTKEER